MESQEEEERRSKVLKQDSQLNHSSQMILGPDLTPTRSEFLANQTPGISNALAVLILQI